MQRIFSSLEFPAEGGVYRDLNDPARTCFPDPVLIEISPPGCFDFPVVDNLFAALPNAFAADTEIDEFPYVDFAAVTANILSGFDSNFPNFWDSFLEEGFEAEVYEISCYCPNVGITRASLTIGRPSFPGINPLQFFWFPPFVQFGDIAALQRGVEEKMGDKESNPFTCCPTDDTPIEYLEGSIVDNTIRIQRIKQADPEYFFRSTDFHSDFTLAAGFPRWCCVSHDCDTGELSGKKVYRWLHFPRWLEDIRDPYDSPAKEPVGVIPFVADIKCDDDSGELFVYFGRLIFHWGILHDIKWDQPAPTPSTPSSPPDNPEDLTYNTDYDGSTLLSALIGNPQTPRCDDSCVVNIEKLIAATQVPLDASCDTPACPSTFCESGWAEFEGTGTSSSRASAIAAAKSDAESAASNCSGIRLQECYVLRTGTTWEARYIACCPPT
jgi:hypothetical protein